MLLLSLVASSFDVVVAWRKLIASMELAFATNFVTGVDVTKEG